MSIEKLKKQGLKRFTATYEDGEVWMRIWTEEKNSKYHHIRHLKDYAKRFLCDSCPLRTNDGPIRCNGIDPERRLVSDSARIIYDPSLKKGDYSSFYTFPLTGLSKNYWDSLRKIIPCKPELKEG